MFCIVQYSTAQCSTIHITAQHSVVPDIGKEHSPTLKREHNMSQPYLAGEREKSPLCVWFWGESVSSKDFIITLGRLPPLEPEREGGSKRG